jgi:AcrR family transcriptional regulator
MGADDARSRLLAAAGPIFAEKGFKTATVREICQAAGVNVASVNYYFGDKERLYVEAVKRAHPFHDAPQPPAQWKPGTPASEKLTEYLRTAVTQMLGTKSKPWQSQLLAREMMNPTAACRELVEEFIRRRFNLLLEILNDILPAGTPPERRHLIALSIVAQFVYFRAARNVIEMLVGDEEVGDHHRAEQIADHIINVTFAMLGLGPPMGEVYGDAGSGSQSRPAVKTTEESEGAEQLDGAQRQVSSA